MYIFSADITCEMLKLCRVTKVKAFFLVLAYVFNFKLMFEFGEGCTGAVGCSHTFSAVGWGKELS